MLLPNQKRNKYPFIGDSGENIEKPPSLRTVCETTIKNETYVWFIPFPQIKHVCLDNLLLNYN